MRVSTGGIKLIKITGERFYKKQIKSRKIISTLLALAMVFSLFAVIPITASAAPASIDISIFDTSNISSPVGDDAWNYVASTHTLYLTQANGRYTLTGINSNLALEVTAADVAVTLNGVDIFALGRGLYNNGSYALTVTLNGANKIETGHISNCVGIYLENNAQMTINGGGRPQK